MKKRYYNAARRQLEFDIILDQIKRRKERFIQRLVRNTYYEGECIVWRGVTNGSGYPNINFWHKGKHITLQAHRLFVMLRIQRPIAKGFEAGHTCGNRRCVRHVFEQSYEENASDGAKARNSKHRVRHQSDGRCGES